MKTRVSPGHSVPRKILLAAVGSAALFLAGCDVDQTQDAKMPDVDVKVDKGNLPKYEVTKTEEGRLPNVDVDAKGGQLPKFDVETADVEVGSKKKTVEVTVPTVKVEMPDDKETKVQ